MILNINVMNVFTIGKTISRKITLTESTSEAESRIAENLKFRPFWFWKYTYIPKWAKYFKSFVIPEMPKLPYRDIVCSDVKSQIQKHATERVVRIWKRKQVVHETEN